MCCPLFFGLKYKINAKKKSHLFVHLDPGPHRTVFLEHLEEGLQYLWVKKKKKTFSDTTLLSVKWDILWIFIHF